MAKAFDPATHRRLRKYQIRSAPQGWWARVPYGTWNHFVTWDQAATWLDIKHQARLIRAAKRESRERASRSS